MEWSQPNSAYVVNFTFVISRFFECYFFVDYSECESFLVVLDFIFPNKSSINCVLFVFLLTNQRSILSKKDNECKFRKNTYELSIKSTTKRNSINIDLNKNEKSNWLLQGK